MLNNFNRIFAMSTRKYNENSLYQSLIQEKMLNFLYYYNNIGRASLTLAGTPSNRGRENDKSASKGNFQRNSGTVSETVSVSSNRGTEWRLFERVCHTLPVVREASCSIPDIGTLRHERRVCDGRRMLQSNL